MRKMGIGLGCFGAFLLALLGCTPTESRIQPPPLQEEYRLPPDDDPRFAKPPEFPKEARKDFLKKATEPPTLPPAFKGQGPGGPRLGGPGLGGN